MQFLIKAYDGVDKLEKRMESLVSNTSIKYSSVFNMAMNQTKILENDEGFNFGG